MVMRNHLCELIVKVNPSLYRKYVIDDKKENVPICVKLQKVVCGTLKAGLLSYQKLLKQLISRGFKMNQYDPCGANRLINGKHVTIVWHMEDIKIYHVDPIEVTHIIKWLDTK